MRKKIAMLLVLLLSTRTAPLSTMANTPRTLAHTASPVFTGKLRIYNETSLPLFVALYARDSFIARAYRISRVEKVEPGQSIDVQRAPLPPQVRIVGLDVWERVVASTQEEELKKNMRLEDLNKVLVGQAGNLPYVFIAPDRKDTIRILTPTEWHVYYPLADAMRKSSFWNSIEKNKKKLQRQFASKQFPRHARVIQGTALSNGEKEFLEKRVPHAQQTLERMLDMPVERNSVPRIAFCCSGGGYRALYATLGWFKGAQHIGLLDSALWAATLSGSSWFLASWITSGLTLHEFHNRLLHKTDKPQNVYINIPKFQEALVKKYVFDQPLSLADVYGAFLSQQLLSIFSDNPYQITLAEQASQLNRVNAPYPLYTAVVAERPYQWMEFTPHVVGSDYLKAYVPTWAFGRHFNKGISTAAAPPQSLGFLMGIWGWPLGIDILELLNRYSRMLPPILARTARELAFTQKRLAPVPVLNYTKGMQGPYGLQEKLYLNDAGLAFNIPLPVVVKKERAVDVIVLLDTNALRGGKNTSLRKTIGEVSHYFDKLPEIDYQAVDARDQGCLIFKNKDPLGPTIIYLPLVKNDAYSTQFDPDQILKDGGYLRSSNFNYTQEQINTLVGLTEFNIIEARDRIKEILKEKISIKAVSTV